MTMIASAGADVAKGAALPLQQARDTFEGQVGEEKARRTHLISYSEGSNAWYASVPAVGTAHPSADWVKFTRYELRQDRRAPGLAELVLHYEQDEFSATYPSPGLPDDVAIEDSTVMEIDIRRHPNWEVVNPADAGPDWPAGAAMADLYDWRHNRIFASAEVPAQKENELGEVVSTGNLSGKEVPESIRGQSAYLVGSGQVTIVEYSYTEPSSVLEQSGKRAVPAGFSGTVENWLVLSAVRQREGAYWTRRIVYQYSAKKINGAVYPDASL